MRKMRNLRDLRDDPAGAIALLLAEDRGQALETRIARYSVCVLLVSALIDPLAPLMCLLSILVAWSVRSAAGRAGHILRRNVVVSAVSRASSICQNRAIIRLLIEAAIHSVNLGKQRSLFALARCYACLDLVDHYLLSRIHPRPRAARVQRVQQPTALRQRPIFGCISSKPENANEKTCNEY